MATVPSSSISCPDAFGYWTLNFTSRDSSSIIQVLHDAGGDEETPLMITSDPQARERRLAEINEILSRTAPPEDRELLLGFAPVLFAETPDRVALGLSAEALVARIRDHFRFVAREIPPPTQLYKGVPGIHVARTPSPSKRTAE